MKRMIAAVALLGVAVCAYGAQGDKTKPADPPPVAVPVAEPTVAAPAVIPAAPAPAAVSAEPAPAAEPVESSQPKTRKAWSPLGWFGAKSRPQKPPPSPTVPAGVKPPVAGPTRPQPVARPGAPGAVVPVPAAPRPLGRAGQPVLPSPGVVPPEHAAPLGAVSLPSPAASEAPTRPATSGVPLPGMPPGVALPETTPPGSAASQPGSSSRVAVRPLPSVSTPVEFPPQALPRPVPPTALQARPPRPVAPTRPTVGSTFPPVPASGAPVQGQVLVDLQIFRVRGDISGKTSLAGDARKRETGTAGLGGYPGGGAGTPEYTGYRGGSAWTCSMHPQIKQPESGKCSICGMDLVPAQASFSSLSLFTEADLMVAGIRFHADERGWTWDGKPSPPPGGKVEVLAAPKVVLIPGNSFVIGIDPQQPVQYFERRPDGLFELKTLNEQTGLTISAIVEKIPSGGTVVQDFDGDGDADVYIANARHSAPDRIVLRNLTIALRSIHKRLPIEGVNLDVGLPEFGSREIKTNVSLQPDRDYGIQLATEGQGFLIFRLRVRHMGPEDLHDTSTPAGVVAPPTILEPKAAPRTPETPGL